MSNEPTIETRVAAGVAWLDENVGPDWHQFVDLDTLNLGSTCGCILGQTFGHFWDAARVLLDGYRLALPGVDLGFNSDEGYASLTDEWERVINQRLDDDAFDEVLM